MMNQKGRILAGLPYKACMAHQRTSGLLIEKAHMRFFNCVDYIPEPTGKDSGTAERIAG